MNSCEDMSNGQLIFIGLGLFDEKDISIKGMNELDNCKKIFAEFYTSKLSGFNKKNFEEKLGKVLTVLSREETEKGDEILKYASKEKVGFLTCGDPMIATTHVDLRLRAMKSGISTKIVHSGSIVTASSGLLGLQNYKFGRATSLVFPEKSYFPTSPYTIIKDNKDKGLHTLILLDIQASKGAYMTANQGMELLLKMEEKQGKNLFDENSLICVVARAGSPKPIVEANSIKALQKKDFGPPLHTLIVPGNLHFMEIEALEAFANLPKAISKKLQKL